MGEFDHRTVGRDWHLEVTGSVVTRGCRARAFWRVQSTMRPIWREMVNRALAERGASIWGSASTNLCGEAFEQFGGVNFKPAQASASLVQFVRCGQSAEFFTGFFGSWSSFREGRCGQGGWCVIRAAPLPGMGDVEAGPRCRLCHAWTVERPFSFGPAGAHRDARRGAEATRPQQGGRDAMERLVVGLRERADPMRPCAPRAGRAPRRVRVVSHGCVSWRCRGVICCQGEAEFRRRGGGRRRQGCLR